jgi:hypothetical protein
MVIFESKIVSKPLMKDGKSSLLGAEVYFKISGIAIKESQKALLLLRILSI